MCVYVYTHREEQSLKISDCILLIWNCNICKNLDEMGSRDESFEGVF